MKRLAYLVAVAALLNACSTVDSGQPALHAVQDQELRSLMARMNGLMMERFMTEEEMDRERSRYAGQIVNAAKILATTAASLQNKLPGLGLSDDEQVSFRALANQLGQHANDLQQQAENNRFNAMSSTLRDVRNTCQACHALFRKF